jgi:hypothetical protein
LRNAIAHFQPEDLSADDSAGMGEEAAATQLPREPAHDGIGQSLVAGSLHQGLGIVRVCLVRDGRVSGGLNDACKPKSVACTRALRAAIP